MRYKATILLWPTKHKDHIEDPDEQRRLNAYTSPLSELERWFDHYSRAVTWCKLTAARKARATDYWMVEEQTDDGLHQVTSRMYDLIPYTPAQQARLDAAQEQRRPVTRPITLPRALNALAEAAAAESGLSFAEMVTAAIVLFINRRLSQDSHTPPTPAPIATAV